MRFDKIDKILNLSYNFNKLATDMNPVELEFKKFEEIKKDPNLKPLLDIYKGFTLEDILEATTPDNIALATQKLSQFIYDKILEINEDERGSSDPYETIVSLAKDLIELSIYKDIFINKIILGNELFDKADYIEDEYFSEDSDGELRVFIYDDSDSDVARTLSFLKKYVSFCKNITKNNFFAQINAKNEADEKKLDIAQKEATALIEAKQISISVQEAINNEEAPKIVFREKDISGLSIIENQSVDQAEKMLNSINSKIENTKSKINNFFEYYGGIQADNFAQKEVERLKLKNKLLTDNNIRKIDDDVREVRIIIDSDVSEIKSEFLDNLAGKDGKAILLKAMIGSAPKNANNYEELSKFILENKEKIEASINDKSISNFIIKSCEYFIQLNKNSDNITKLKKSISDLKEKFYSLIGNFEKDDVFKEYNQYKEDINSEISNKKRAEFSLSHAMKRLNDAIKSNNQTVKIKEQAKIKELREASKRASENIKNIKYRFIEKNNFDPNSFNYMKVLLNRQSEVLKQRFERATDLQSQQEITKKFSAATEVLTDIEKISNESNISLLEFNKSLNSIYNLDRQVEITEEAFKAKIKNISAESIKNIKMDFSKLKNVAPENFGKTLDDYKKSLKDAMRNKFSILKANQNDLNIGTGQGNFLKTLESNFVSKIDGISLKSGPSVAISSLENILKEINEIIPERSSARVSKNWVTNPEAQKTNVVIALEALQNNISNKITNNFHIESVRNKELERFLKSDSFKELLKEKNSITFSLEKYNKDLFESYDIAKFLNEPELIAKIETVLRLKKKNNNEFKKSLDDLIAFVKSKNLQEKYPNQIEKLNQLDLNFKTAKNYLDYAEEFAKNFFIKIRETINTYFNYREVDSIKSKFLKFYKEFQDMNTEVISLVFLSKKVFSETYKISDNVSDLKDEESTRSEITDLINSLKTKDKQFWSIFTQTVSTNKRQIQSIHENYTGSVKLQFKLSRDLFKKALNNLEKNSLPTIMRDMVSVQVVKDARTVEEFTNIIGNVILLCKKYLLVIDAHLAQFNQFNKLKGLGADDVMNNLETLFNTKVEYDQDIEDSSTVLPKEVKAPAPENKPTSTINTVLEPVKDEDIFGDFDISEKSTPQTTPKEVIAPVSENKPLSSGKTVLEQEEIDDIFGDIGEIGEIGEIRQNNDEDEEDEIFTPKGNIG